MSATGSTNRMRGSGTASSSAHEPEHIDVNAMLLFYEVVNAGSINQAAVQLNAPKSTISRRLRHLEQHVGAVLLKRGPLKLSLTSSGKVLYQHCERILAEAQGARAAVAEVQSEVTGQLQIATAFGLSPWVNRALASFVLAYPNVEVIVDETQRWIDVREEPYDIAVHLGPIRNERLPVRRFAELQRGVYAGPAYLAGRTPPRAPDDLLRHSCIVLHQQLADGLWRFREANTTRDVTVTPRVRVSNLIVAHDLALAGLGCAVLPHALCRQDVADGKLVQVLPAWQLAPLVPAATYLERRHMPLRVRAFLDTLTEQFRHDHPG